MRRFNSFLISTYSVTKSCIHCDPVSVFPESFCLRECRRRSFSGTGGGKSNVNPLLSACEENVRWRRGRRWNFGTLSRRSAMAFMVCSKRADEGTIGVDGGSSVSGEIGGESSADTYGIEFGR